MNNMVNNNKNTQYTERCIGTQYTNNTRQQISYAHNNNTIINNT